MMSAKSPTAALSVQNMISRRILVKQGLVLHRFLITHLTDISIARIKSIIFIKMYGRYSFKSALMKVSSR